MARAWHVHDKILNRWEIHEILGGPGRSGMGIVYVVYDHELHEPLAAKTFQDELLAAETVRLRFVQESLAWVNLDHHQNVTRARFVDTIQGKPYLFLEYVSGGDLGAWIGTPRLTQDLAQVLRFAIQLCDGMTHALSRGIKAHRDIKPQNCLLTGDGILKVTDFGLAKVFAGPGADTTNEVPSFASSVELSQTGAAIGTASHMAPEQFDDAKAVDVRADIYAFGVTLFQMLTGRRPFVGRTPEEYRRLHQSHPLPELPSHLSGVEGVVHTCLAKNPTQRFADFIAPRRTLAALYEELTGEPAPAPAQAAALESSGWSDKAADLTKLGRNEEALLCCDRSLALDSRNGAAWNNKGVALIELCRYEEALASAERALASARHARAPWANRAAALRKLRRPEEALAACDRVLELYRYDPTDWSNKGSVLLDLGRFEEALACYDRALELDPKFAEAWTGKGGILRRLKRFAPALSCHERALELSPRSVEGWSNHGAVLASLGRLTEALTSYDRALAIDPAFVGALYNRGTALMKLERPREALASFDRALELDPQFDRAWANKGAVLGALGRTQEQLECFDRALALDSTNGTVWLNKGEVLSVGLGRYRDALRCYENAHRLGLAQAAPGISQCREALAREEMEP